MTYRRLRFDRPPNSGLELLPNKYSTASWRRFRRPARPGPFRETAEDSARISSWKNKILNFAKCKNFLCLQIGAVRWQAGDHIHLTPTDKPASAQQ